MNKFKKILQKINGRTVLVVGDIILDSYLWSKPNRVSPEAPVIIMDVEHEENRLGGAGNVALNLKTLGCEPILVGFVGNDLAGDKVLALLDEEHIIQKDVIRVGGGHTTVKKRVMAHKQQVVRLDWGGHVNYVDYFNDEIMKRCEYHIKGGVGAVIVSDYGKGVLNHRVLSDILTSACVRQIPACVDPKRINFKSYHNAGLITPNEAEASEMSGVHITDDVQTLKQAARNIMENLSIKNCLITQGEAGMSLFKKEEPFDRFIHIPAWEREDVFDVTGAGDTVISVMAACLAAGANMVDAAKIANVAAGLVVQVVGCGAVTLKDLMAQASKIK